MSKKAKTPEARTVHFTFPGAVTIAPLKDESGALLAVDTRIIPGSERDRELASDFLYAVVAYFDLDQYSSDARDVLWALLNDKDRVRKMIAEKNAAKIMSETVRGNDGCATRSEVNNRGR